MTNFVGFIIAWGIHSPLAHGLTGDHDDYLTLSQFIAHTIGLFEVGAVIALFQKRVFRRIAPVTDRMVWTTIAFMPVMFWIGYYKAGVPYDLLLAFATIGFIGGMTLRPHLERGNLWLLANTLGFGAGLGVTAMATYPIADELMGAMDGGLIGHTITFLYIGAVSGASSGALTGLALLKLRAGETP
jgi:hypothetical protein